MNPRVLVALIGSITLGCYHFAQLEHRLSSRPDANAPSVYADRCSSCHGDAGQGDGPAGQVLEPRPRNFADRGWQASTADDRIRFVIRNGGRAAGLSASMAPHPDLSDQELDALVAYIRSIGALSSARAARTDRSR